MDTALAQPWNPLPTIPGLKPAAGFRVNGLSIDSPDSRLHGSRGRSPWYVPPGVIHRLRLRENEPILVGAETEPVGNCSGEGGTGGEPGRHLPGALISDVDRKRPDLVDLDQDVACCIAPVCKVAKGFRSGEPQSKEAWP